MYCLVIFYVAFKKDMAATKPLAKVSIQCNKIQYSAVISKDDVAA